ncbi:allatotropin isoform X3 [Spodoptera frugiperda]|uniref:Allatotropin isoform X3 n=1 Tax=Spodoptera frugiperda TaxID=7108 RepID=A0A9R0D9U6_SPOFR|nr:allatotropin isoform X3 [Spodoptera frugiperda]
MNISMHLAVAVAAAACLCVCAAAPENRLARTKQQRPTRGFKNVEMMTARGFGKRDRPHTRAERDVEHQAPTTRSHRGTPTFKSPTVGIARDFGKRAPELDTEDQDSYDSHARRKFNPKSNLMVAYDFGKRSGNDDVTDEAVYGLDNFWEMLEATPEREGQENDEKTLESIPLDWFVNEMLNNPDFARSVVRKFIDLNQDGMLSSEELLRNVV